MSTSLWGDKATEFFYELSPESVLSAIDKLGFKTNGRLMTLNSMENRVYDLEIDNHESYDLLNTFIVAKFYRPGRWSKNQILDEHEFLFDLKEAEIPVVAPLEIDGESLFYDEKISLYFTLYPKFGGRAPDELNAESAERLGTLLARVHEQGAMKKANHRLTFNADNFIKANREMILATKILPNYLEDKYIYLTDELYKHATLALKNLTLSRIHGDCHLGNIIARSEQYYLIDFDDFLIGPAIQDLWLLAPASDEEGLIIRNHLIEGYQTIRDLNPHDFSYLEVLRSMRLVHYQAWLTKRREDPTFKHHFGDIEASSFWERHIKDLHDQVDLIERQKSQTFIFD